MNNYKVSLLGLCETKWTQLGQPRLSSGETILYSGHEEEDGSHTEGVAPMLGKEAQRALQIWEAVSSRIIAAKFRTKINFNLDVEHCYNLKNEAEDEKKGDVYSRLQRVLGKQRDKDIKVLMGDFNTKIGADNRGYERERGRHGVGITNENWGNVCRLLHTEQRGHRRQYFPI